MSGGLVAGSLLEFLLDSPFVPHLDTNSPLEESKALLQKCLLGPKISELLVCASEAVHQALIHGRLLYVAAHNALVQVLETTAQNVAQDEEGVEDAVDAIHGVF